MGFLISESILNSFAVSILDKNEEAILWLQLKSKENEFKFNVCVCYLPPARSTRSVNVHEYFDTLLSQVYRYQHDGPYFICGDFNARSGHLTDYIAGVDNIPDREVIDHCTNAHGDSLIEFLLSANCCILNGRNAEENDFTCVKPGIGTSVVDYCLTPHHDLDIHKNFKVIRARELFNVSGCLTRCEPASISDHSVIYWNMDLSKFAVRDKTSSRKITETQSRIKYNLSTIPNNWLEDQSTITMLQEFINNMEQTLCTQENVDDCYNSFVNLVTENMQQHIEHRKVKVYSGDRPQTKH